MSSQDNTSPSLSRVGIKFGDFFDTPEGEKAIKSFMNMRIDLSLGASYKQLEELRNLTKDKLNMEYAVIVALRVTSKNKEELVELLNNILTGQNINSEFNHTLFEIIQREDLKMEYYAGEENVVFVCLKLGSMMEEVAIAQLKLFMSLGLENILASSSNSLEISIKSNNSFEDISKACKLDGESFGSALTRSLALELKFNFSLYDKLSDMLDNAGVLSPLGSKVLESLGKIKKLDIDFKFKGSDALDKGFRKEFLNSIYKLEKIKIDSSNEKPYFTFLNLVEPEFDVYFTISDVVAFKANVFAPGFTEFFAHFFTTK